MAHTRPNSSLRRLGLAQRVWAGLVLIALPLVTTVVDPNNISGLNNLAIAQSDSKTQLRLYKISRHGNSQRIRFTRKDSKVEGCHNLKIKSTRVHRAVHFGFESCSLFSEKDCAPESVIKAKLSDEAPGKVLLTQGKSWYLGAALKDDEFYRYNKAERGKKVRSWSCQGYAEPPIEHR